MNAFVKEQHKCRSCFLFVFVFLPVYRFGLIAIVHSIGNVGDDCPVFDGLFDYCSISAGGSMGMHPRAFVELFSSDARPTEQRALHD